MKKEKAIIQVVLWYQYCPTPVPMLKHDIKYNAIKVI